MIDKEIYIHVGLPKTGTTFLQRNVFSHFKDIYYLDIRSSEYSSLFRDIFYKNFTTYPLSLFKEEFKKFINQIPENKILISDEAWFGATLGGSHYNFSNYYYLTRLLKEIIPNAKIILTIRRQDKWLESMYKHLLREGYSLGIKSFLNYKKGNFKRYSAYFRIGPNIDIRTLDYRFYIENYENLFGEGNILIIPQELLMENVVEFIDQVCKFTNSTYNVNIERGKHKANSGYLYVSSFLAQILNKLFIFKSKGGGIFPIPKNKYLDFRNYLRMVDSLFPCRKSRLTTKMREQIMDFHSAGNLIIDKKYNLNLKKYKYYE